MDFSNMMDTAKPVLIAFGLKVLGAIAIYIVGRWLIGVANTLITKALTRQKVEPTIVRYVGNALGVALIGILYYGALGQGAGLAVVARAFGISLLYLFALALGVAVLYRHFSQTALPKERS